GGAAMGGGVCRDERGGWAAGRILGRRGKSHHRVRAEDSPTSLCATAPGFPRVPLRTGLFKDCMAANILDLPALEQFQHPPVELVAAEIFVVTVCAVAVEYSEVAT